LAQFLLYMNAGLEADVAQLQQQVGTVLTLLPPLLDSALVWRDSSVASTKTREQQERFKVEVMQAYGGVKRCCILQDKVIPANLVIVAHIMKSSHAKIARALEMDVWSSRNGLLLCKVGSLRMAPM
jgi:hypothetical protein